MVILDKFLAYSKLSEIKNNPDVSNEANDHIKKVFNEDSLPYETIIFINKYLPLDQLSVYNRIYENRRKNPLYKNLVNEKLSVEDKAIALNSLLTQILINNKKLRESGNIKDAELFNDFMGSSEINSALGEYLCGNHSKLEEVFDMVRETFKKLYNKEDQIA